jgi:hypothetical protein
MLLVSSSCPFKTILHKRIPMGEAHRK